jgi:hypothetical protein
MTTSDLSTTLSSAGSVEAVAGADGPGRVETEPAREHGEAPEQDPLLVGQEVVAPVDRRLQGLVAGGGVPRAAHEQREAVAETGLDLAG